MDKITNQNTVLHEPTIYRHDREKMNDHKSAIIWFTGLSSSGKSTLAYALEDILHKNMIRTYVLDGDNIRHGLSCDLDFSVDDQSENLRRIGEVTKLFFDSGSIVLVSVISPFIKDREKVRKLINSDNFFEIYVKIFLIVKFSYVFYVCFIIRKDPFKRSYRFQI